MPTEQRIALRNPAPGKLGATIPGSIRWYVTAVKLDLEARGELYCATVQGRHYVTVAKPALLSEERR